jgi:hypothetical protein
MTTTATPDTLRDIARLAAAGRLVKLGYRRPGAQITSEYVVEPYRLHRFSSGTVVHGWQVSPVPDGASPWRDFRLDRIDAARDGGAAFEPRIPVTLPQDLEGGSVDAPAVPPLARWSERPIADVGPDEEYYRQLETAMLDGQVSPEEMAMSKELGDRVDPSHRKSVHARIYAAVLHEVVADGRISHREELYLGQVREFLSRLGWAP